MNLRRHAATLATWGLVAAAVAACGDGPTGGGNPPARAPTISAASVVSGGEGVVSGSNLDLLPATIAVDGRSVAPASRTSTEIRFVMPPGRPCEVDGRAVVIAAGPLSYTARLSVPSVVRLEPGESRLLGRDQIASLCLQLPAAEQGFVLSVLNPDLAEGAGTDALFTVNAWTDGGAPVAQAARPRFRDHPSRSEPPERFDVTQGSDFYSADPVPFDPAYATAAVGDTVRWVDFRSPLWYNNGSICRQPNHAVPTFGAVVAATSASGRTVIAFDERTRYSAEWTSPAARARLARVADIAEQWTLPAIREALAPGYQPVRGGAGRWWHIFRTGVAQPTVDQAGLPRSMCPHYSEVAATLGPDAPLASDDQIEVVAAYLIHEYAHHAEDVIAVRRWGNVFGRGSPGWPGVNESWAQAVQETAARLASNQPTGARYDALRPGSGVPYADFYMTGYGERPDLSPWSGGRGPYDHGARLLLFLREQWGDAPFASARERFYERAIGLPTYDFASMAALAGMDPLTALDRWSLAEATDDLVAPAAAAAHGLPQIRSWAPQDREPLARVSRASNSAHPVAVANGSYAALYFYGTMPARGVSLTFTNLGSAPFVARLTRLN